MTTIIPVSLELIADELKGVRAIADKWISKIEAGVPGITAAVVDPNNNFDLEDFIRELCGELLVASGKCETLSSVVGDNLR